MKSRKTPTPNPLRKGRGLLDTHRKGGLLVKERNELFQQIFRHKERVAKPH